MQMMHQVAIRMRDLHALGYVHRDLKPGNVMWLPRHNRWTIIDFGCAARTGDDARLGFSLAYAAPEVIKAYRQGDKTMVAQVRHRSKHRNAHIMFEKPKTITPPTPTKKRFSQGAHNDLSSSLEHR
jgi:serine/threonine protein kinase